MFQWFMKKRIGSQREQTSKELLWEKKKQTLKFISSQPVGSDQSVVAVLKA